MTLRVQRVTLDDDARAQIYETSMKNPWLAKNPIMSAWLSAFNTNAGAARGHMTREANRHATAMMTEATRQAFRFWTAGIAAPPKAARRKKAR